MQSQARYKPSPGETLRLGDVAINYHAAIRDPLQTTVVMVHGFGANLATWDDIYPALAAQFSVVSLDLKGAGFSSKPADKAYGPHDQAEILLSFISTLGLKKVVLVGHSLGGGISVIAYLRNLQTQATGIVGLVLIASVVYPQKLPFFVKALRNPVTRFMSKRVPAERRVRMLLDFCMEVKSRITPRKIQNYALPLKLPGAEAALAQTAKTIVPPDLDAIVARLPEISVPTLLIWGKEDRVASVEKGHRLHKAIPQSGLVVLPATGHVPHEERPQEVARMISDFLATIP